MSVAVPAVRKLSRHVFVCMNERAPGHARGDCKTRGAEAVLEAFKSGVKAAGLGTEVRAQKSGCLDVCEHGPSVVVYPEGVWYARVTPEDAREIVASHLVKGVPVERLRLAGK
jgi:(2Fe-2S) ferredoxin